MLRDHAEENKACEDEGKLFDINMTLTWCSKDYEKSMCEPRAYIDDALTIETEFMKILKECRRDR